MKLYSQRNRPPPEYLLYSLSPDVRARIFTVFEERCPNHKGGARALMAQMESVILRKYGHFAGPGFEALRRSRDPVVEHFFSCSDEQALDYIEACLQQPAYEGEQAGVDEINEIFLEEGIGYELTPFSFFEVEETFAVFGKRKARKTVFPEIIRRDQHVVHQTVVEQVLKLLSSPRFHVANEEMLRAFAAIRNQDFEGAITMSGSAFESLMKTICDLKGWPYDTKDTCAKLVRVLKENGLFPGFYAPSLEGIGTIRNNIGDAHGRGPQGTIPVEQANAEHMVHVTASHMLFLAKQAGLG